MTIEELHADEKLRQQEFPVVKEGIFLAHAGVAPIPRRVADAVVDYAGRCSQGDQESMVPESQLDETRELLAQLIGARPGEIAFVGPTSLALSFIASGLSLARGSNVVIYRDDYPSNVYPWMALAAKGVEVRFVQVPKLGEIRPGDVLKEVDGSTALVALASCHFIAGYRIDLKGISQELRKRNILFCVDGIQTAGAFPTPCAHFDFLAADAHKWLLGPCAAGMLYVRQDLQEALQPEVYGWHNVRSPNFIAQEQIRLRTGARRYEAGTHNLLGLVGLRAAVGLLLEIGVEKISRELIRKRRWLVAALEEEGFRVLHGELDDEQAGGITSFEKPGSNMGEIHERLAKERIHTSLRQDRSGQSYIRLSPHFYNTDRELERVLKVLGT